MLKEYARIAAGRLYAVLLHDQRSFADNPARTVEALWESDRLLSDIPDAPLVFVEYAAGLDPDLFARLFEESADTRLMCAAIDVGHVGIQVCRNAYREEHPNEDICALQPDTPQLPDLMSGVQRATARALPAVAGLTERLATLGKPLHFHLHDGHPLSNLSLFGVSDHLSFLQQLELPFSYQGRRLIDGMFGASGLHRIIHTALDSPGAGQLSFMFELHPRPGRSPLGNHQRLFEHWRDRTNAERMNYWLDRLLDNVTLARTAWEPGR